jgi:hypothetical protein
VVEYLFKTLNVGMCGVVVFVLTESVVLFLFFGWECCALDLFVCVVFLFVFFLWERNSVINTKTFFS